MTGLERQLAGLAADYPFPQTPDLAGMAADRLAPARTPWTLPWRLAVVLAAAAVALGGTLALSSTARGALADLFDFVPGVRIERVERLPDMVFSRSGAYGEQVSLAEAERRAPFELLLPEALGEPDLAYHYRDRAGAAVVTVVWGDRANARAVLTIWPLDSLLAHKIIGHGTYAESVQVRGTTGMWISGIEHAVFYLGLDNGEHRADAALAGNVLVWQEGDLAYRLEAGLTLERALELAAELR